MPKRRQHRNKSETNRRKREAVEDVILESSSDVAEVEEFDLNALNIDLDLTLPGDYRFRGLETPIDISVSRDLVALEDSTQARKDVANQQLARMDDLGEMTPEMLDARKIIHPGMGNYNIINAFREIRTRLLQKSNGKNFSVMVVSLNSNMGSTFTAVNLGAAFAYEGEKTALLVECNQHDGKLNELLGLRATIGLSNYLVDPEMDVSDIIYPVGISRMRVVPFGNAKNSRMEFFTSERMREFFPVVKRRYIDRYIVVHAPPLEMSADAAILSSIVDQVLVVVPYGKVSNARLRTAIKMLPKKKIAGLLLNNCKSYV